MQQQQFFLGGISPSGFQSRFHSQIVQPGFYTYILKGGPGTGKSTLMRKIAAAFPDEPISLYACSSDCRSLDAVVLESRGIIVVDGTAPHVFEAEVPLVGQELLNLGAQLDRSYLQKNEAEIRALFQSNARQHTRARQYVQAIAALHGDLSTIGAQAMLRNKLSGFAERLAKRHFPKQSNHNGRQSFAQRAALTAEGYLTMPLPEGYQVTLLNDTLFAGSDYLLRALADAAQLRGLHCIISECLLLEQPVYEHLLIPELHLAFAAVNAHNSPSADTGAMIHFTRFYDKSFLATKKQRISFNLKASKSLLTEAASAIGAALTLHDTLESYYIHALNFAGVQAETEALVERIRQAPQKNDIMPLP